MDIPRYSLVMVLTDYYKLCFHGTPVADFYRHSETLIRFGWLGQPLKNETTIYEALRALDINPEEIDIEQCFR